MNKEDMEIEKIKIYSETLRQTIWARYNIIFSVSMLSAAILVVATFNPEITSLSICTTKILVAILLSLIPISLIDYSLKLSHDANKLIAKIDPTYSVKKSLLQNLWDGSSYIYVAIVTLVIIFIIFSIF